MDRLNGHFPMSYKGHNFKVYFEMYPEHNSVFIPPVFGDDYGLWDLRKIQYSLENLSADIDVLEKGLNCVEGELNQNAIYEMLELRFINHAFHYGDLTQLDKDTYFKMACVILRYLLESLGNLEPESFLGYAVLAYNKMGSIQYQL